MKVLHVASAHVSSGAGRGVYWLHLGLREIGVDSTLVIDSSGVRSVGTIDVAETRLASAKHLVRMALSTLPRQMYNSIPGASISNGFFGMNVRRFQQYHQADLIHFHWINGLVTLSQLTSADKPSVWTIRDMWAFTGGCHYTLGCEGFIKACGQCPQLQSRSSRDLTRAMHWNKKRLLSKGHPRIVAISSWLSQEARRSSILRDRDVAVIPNCVDTDEFLPLRRTTAREALGVDTELPVVLVGAQDLGSTYKGFGKFIDSVKYQGDYFYLVIGGISESTLKGFGRPYKCLGFLRDSVALRMVYSAADVYVSPSLQEAFGKMTIEAMACGTPAVAFDRTGASDIITHRIDGYLARPFDAEDLAEGIRWAVSAGKDARLPALVRAKVERSFSTRVVAQQYRQLYEQVLSGRVFKTDS